MNREEQEKVIKTCQNVLIILTEMFSELELMFY